MPTMKKEKNGCKLYRLLFAHYFSSDHVNHLANKMEACLASLTYHREQKNWDWSQYVEQHRIAKNLMEHGYSDLDERSKVCHLLTGIQDNAVQPMVCQVLAMREEVKTFMTFLALFADYICHLKQNKTLPMYAMFPSLAAVGAPAARPMMLVVGVVAEVGVAA
jgi:hypothetical protein